MQHKLYLHRQEVTKRCRLSRLTNSALVYEPKCGGAGVLRGLSQWVQLQLYTGAQINSGDLNSLLNLWSPVLKKTFLAMGWTARFRLLRWRKKRHGSRRKRPACWWRWPPRPPSHRHPARPGYPRLPAWHHSPDTDFFRVAGADPYVFGPPGSGSIIQRYGSGSGSGSFYHQAKIVRKPLISTVLWLLHDFLSLKNDDVNVPSKSNMQKNFCWRLEGQWQK